MEEPPKTATAGPQEWKEPPCLKWESYSRGLRRDIKRANRDLKEAFEEVGVEAP